MLLKKLSSFLKAGKKTNTKMAKVFAYADLAFEQFTGLDSNKDV